MRDLTFSSVGYLIVDTQSCFDGGGFETMAFHADENGHITDYSGVDVVKSYTQEDAEQAHRKMLEKWHI